MGLILPGDKRPGVFYDAEVAKKLGINIAIVLSRIIWSIEEHITSAAQSFFRDGRWWMYESVTGFCNYSCLGRDAVKRALKEITTLNLVHTCQYEASTGQCSNWYAIDGDVLAKTLSAPPPLVQNQPVGTGAKPTSGVVENQPVGGAKPTTPTGAKPTSLSKSLRTKNPKNHTESPPPLPISEVIPLKLKKRPRKEEDPMTPQDIELGKRWHAHAIETSKSKPQACWSDEFFAQHIAKTRKATDLSIEIMIEIFEYLKGGCFWTKNAISTKGLLEVSKTTGLRKIDAIRISMDEEKAKKQKGGRYEQRPQTRDYSADNGKFDKFDDKKPWLK